MIKFPISDFSNADEILSPALLVFPDIVKFNIQEAIKIAGSAERLRPHVKTHKVPQIVKMQLEAGITKFKCSTLAELKMTAEVGAKDILLAYPLMKPAFAEFHKLVKQWPEIKISLITDNKFSLELLENFANENNLRLPVFVDIDNGMHRTGIAPNDEALALYKMLVNSKSLKAAGLHVYDGHLHINNFEERKVKCKQNFSAVLDLRKKLHAHNFLVPELICGGTPTFNIHAEYKDRILSPGTFSLYDAGYKNMMPELPFETAAWLLSRVISKPDKYKLCLDLGHKAIASEMKPPRIVFTEFTNYELFSHSEEHLVITTHEADKFQIGDILYGVPWHICPTVNLHDQFYVIENQQIKAAWPIIARDRNII